jgi:inhibitor of KinA
MSRAENKTAFIKPVWFPAGDKGVLLDLTGYGAQLGGLPPADKRQTLTRYARTLSQQIEQLRLAGKLAGITDIVPGLASLLVHYNPLHITAEQIKSAVAMLLEGTDDSPSRPTRKWCLPVLYGGAAGPDLEEVAARCQISAEEVITRHCQTELEIGIMGFLPGLAYMTGLDSVLHLPRRSEPRTHVPGGSVAIAMDQTVIYPLDSPGGWNLIGKMPIPLFDAKRPEPVLLRAGEKISFRAITPAEYDALQLACANGQLPIRAEEV